MKNLEKFGVQELDAVEGMIINGGTDIPYAEFSHNNEALNNPVSAVGVGIYNAGVAVYNGGVWVVNTVSSWF